MQPLKAALTLMLLLLISLSASSRRIIIVGQITDGANNQAALPGASVRLLKPDSSMVTGAVSNDKGQFQIATNKAARYLLEVKFLGYATLYRSLELTSRTDTLQLEHLKLQPAAISLGEAKVKAAAIKVIFKKDTIEYNANAFFTPEGAPLKRLVEQLPGVSVNNDGSITVNGKPVTEIKLNGKDFFKGDTQTAMNNLPANMVSKIKVYEEKSDLAKRSGVDDGKRKTVLDVNLKKELKSTLSVNGSLGGGTKERYDLRNFMNYFTDLQRLTFMGQSGNLSDIGHKSNIQFGPSLQWTNNEKWDAPGRVEISANFYYNHDTSNTITSTNSETFLQSGQSNSFSNSRTQDLNWNSSYTGSLSFTWNIDSTTALLSDISFKTDKARGWSSNLSATFNGNPYQFPNLLNPLEAIHQEPVDERLSALAVNRNNHQAQQRSRNNEYNYSLTFFHRFDSLGQYIYINGAYRQTRQRAHNFNISDIKYYQTGALAPQSFYNQYAYSPTVAHDANFSISYNKPLTKRLSVHSNYNLGYSDNNSDKLWYELDSLIQYQAQTHPAIGTLPTADSLAIAYNAANSQYSTYREVDQEIGLGIQYNNNQKIIINGELQFNPNYARLKFNKDDFSTVVKRNPFHISPRLDARFQLGERQILSFDYISMVDYPSMTLLIDVPDKSDPLSVYHGNKDLKPSSNNFIQSEYTLSIPKHVQGIRLNASFMQTRNTIANTITYIPETGGQIVQPVNVNGNWDCKLFAHYNRSLDKDNKFQLEASHSATYRNSVGFVTSGMGQNMVNLKNTVRSLGINPNVKTSYRNEAFDVELGVALNYQHSTADHSSFNNLNICNMNYTLNTTWHTRSHFTLTSNLFINTRSGYDDPNMNTAEYLWSVYASQSFWKDEKLTLSLGVEDLLQSRKSFSRDISATGKSETRVNTIGRYAMLKLIYKFNIFGHKE